MTHALHQSECERERKRERLGRERERWKEGEIERGRERERCRICPELLFLFLEGMTGAMAPFSYLVFYKTHVKLVNLIRCLHQP